MGVDLPRASSSLRLGSRIVPWTLSSLGNSWPFMEFSSQLPYLEIREVKGMPKKSRPEPTA